MKYVLNICLLFIFAFPVYAGQMFFYNIPDIPIMEGIEEQLDQGVSFDKPEGRIIESVAIMHGVSREELLKFYKMTLPQLGWGLVNDNSYFRKRELLEINFEENNGHDFVRIMIRPVN